MRELALLMLATFAGGCQSATSPRDLLLYSATLLDVAKFEPAKLERYITSSIRVHTRSGDTDASKAVANYVKDCEFYSLTSDEGQAFVIYARAKCRTEKLDNIRVEGGATLLEKRTTTLVYSNGALADIWLGEYTPPNTMQNHVVPNERVRTGR